jgi:hypothetical protein
VDYKKHYDSLIERAKERILNGYVETHHVIPVCIGGDDDKKNLVQLTAEEHYVAHQLLHKIYPNVSGLAFAMIAMTGKTNPHRRNKAYGWVRKRHAIAMSETSSKMWEDQQYRDKHKASMDKLRNDPIYVEKVANALSKTHKGRVKSVQERLNIAEAGRKRAPRKFSEQARLNMAEARRKTWEERRASGTHLEIAKKVKETRLANGGYKMSEEHRKAFSQSQKGKIPWNKGMKK